jgi:hypothetical protein
MTVRAILAVALVLAAVTSAPAQMPPQPPPPAMPFPFPSGQGSEEERAACHPDVVRLCPDAIPDQFRILSCLQSNRPKISNACRNVLASHGV